MNLFVNMINFFLSVCIDLYFYLNTLQIIFFQDTLLVIERYKSGFQPPGDIPFEDLNGRGSDSNSMPPPISTVGGLRPEPMTFKGTMSSGKLKKRVGLFGIFSSNKVCVFYFTINNDMNLLLF